MLKIDEPRVYLSGESWDRKRSWLHDVPWETFGNLANRACIDICQDVLKPATDCPRRIIVKSVFYRQVGSILDSRVRSKIDHAAHTFATSLEMNRW